MERSLDMLKTTILYDIDDYRAESAKKYSFLDNKESIIEYAKEYGKFETVLVVTVFHHCDEPEVEIEFLSRVAKRVIIIESVINETMSWGAQGVVDWLYNRGMHPGASIPVPGNFKTVENWKEIFVKHGFETTRIDDLGQDLPIVPEYHVLFVLDKVENN